MKEERKKIISLISVGAVLLFLVVAYFTTTEDTVQESFWSLLPPLIAIVLALGTKEVYSSLFIGILSGGLLFSGFGFEGSIRHIFMDSIIPVLSTSANVGIICFLVILGMMVQLINKTGGSRAFGDWTKDMIETRSGALLATVTLGCLLFIDDYFNCLTVGSVMRPVTDKHRISRAKLAYIIDTTAAPICIIAPISSWAAAVSGFVEGEDGMKIFLETIPYNFYALLSICMMLFLIILKVDFASMWVHERNAEEKGDLFTTAERPYGEGEEDKGNKGKTGSIPDMLVPIFLLILSCIIGLIYSGGFFAGADFITAFSHSDAPTGLVLGSFMALVISLIYYLSKKAISFQEAMNCLPEGFRQMVPAILILTFAWSLKAMTDSLGAKDFVSELVEGRADTMLSFLPSFVFLIAVGLSFATGTSWGTFGILIPIVVGVFDKSDYNMMIISIASCMAGAVCGDHCSPISDTTIMSSAGAQCVHLNHVSTQLPYAILVALVSLFAYIMAGFIKNPWVSFSAAAILLFFILLQIKHIQVEREEERQRRKRRVLR